MPIDTRVDGNPESIRAAAAWLRTSLGPMVVSAADQLYQARNTADAGWDGTAGDGFSARATVSAGKADDLATAVAHQALAFDEAAAQLQRAQDDMGEVRAAAATAGLAVVGDQIQEPGPMPVNPGSPPNGADATVEALSAYTAAVGAVERHEALMRAYDSAQHGVDAARELWAFAVKTVKNVWADLSSKWFFVVGDLVNGAAGVLAARHASALLKNSEFFAGEASKYLELARTAPAGTPASQIYRDFDTSRLMSHTADDAAAAAARSEASASKLGLKAGGVLAAAGIAYDIYNGKPAGQAVVSGAAGFGASLLAGAGAGAVVGSVVPGVGTAVGAGVGVVAGLFTSGAVDSLYQNGVDDLDDAVESGVDAVADAGAAVGGLAKGAWNAVF
ncbi:hypothetical protein [Rhodococcus sp. UNC363MFTsu5.1]|uniref:hypothetical protein n=1 Tax=Rhodococcus sp. UNC363MFTsu5.1 TaxID=1449069 RepID=UPI0012DEB1D0|nr:hypothetical protein [Rhodococcus sp. UNC363MFTsu5.1]